MDLDRKPATAIQKPLPAIDRQHALTGCACPDLHAQVAMLYFFEHRQVEALVHAAIKARHHEVVRVQCGPAKFEIANLAQFNMPVKAPDGEVIDRLNQSRIVSPRKRRGERWHQSFIVRNRSALLITDTELRLMAAPAIIGLSSKPKKG